VGGQGISIALKDARLVSEALRASPEWSPGTLADYVWQRREQMNRLRFATRLMAIYRMEFTEDARLRRKRGRERMAAEPELALPFVAMQKGPLAVPREAFSQRVWDALLG
jgi:2-polyprenyl-6-methoxyphenol hydroxylase-like FAD-dependent oxidoreductase